MYRLCLRRDFGARHFLVGGEWGPENSPHPHRYRIEWELSAVVRRYRDALLNDLPEFAGLNPSLERFAKIIWERLSGALRGDAASSVRLWESEQAWAGYDGPRNARPGG